MFVPQPGFDFTTLGSWNPRFTIHADCAAPGCGHLAKLDRAGLEKRFGSELLAGDLKRMLRCAKCGSDAVRLTFAWDALHTEAEVVKAATESG